MKKWIIKGIRPDKTEFYISKHGNILSTNEQIWSDEAFTLKVSAQKRAYKYKKLSWVDKLLLTNCEGCHFKVCSVDCIV